MGLQRTPPPRSQPLSSAPPSQPIEEDVVPSEVDKTNEADKTTLSNLTPARAFVPRHPGVMRTPPHGSSEAEEFRQPEHVDERPIRPAPSPMTTQDKMDVDPVADEEEEKEAEQIVEAEKVTEDVDLPVATVSMELDGQEHESPINPASPSTPPSIPQSSTSQAGPSNSAIDAVPTTPATQPAAPKTPRSRRKTMEPLPSPPKPLPLDENEYEFGRRYQLTMETLERAVKAGAQRWTADHFRGCFPVMAKDLSKAMENTCLSASQTMRNNIMTNAKYHMEHYKVGPALRAIDEVDKEARDHLRANPAESEQGKLGRPDAWRPDLAPNALVASSVLPIYDDAYSKLREEYVDLHKYCSEKYKSIIDKQKLLEDLEGGVADGVVDLDKTIEIFNKLPVEEMMLWTESAETKLETRAPEQVS
ncbi:uncharacterized protein IL334_003579 [Kwoniella shivajii]|uniref:Uncharacterized protein n=1 Tax=Kwoniella shivajii TaxID=564305 RepID=A0ABZ1CZN6_9TREE|nr:hypothetical protein IL334_003579 [Kwoniella shivajii]